MSGPVPHSRWMTGGYDGSSLFYWNDGDEKSPRQIKPSMAAWIPRDNGEIIDDDHIGGVTMSPAADWCAEAVGGGNLEVWAVQLSGHRMASVLFNRSPTAANITARWTDLGLEPSQQMAVRDVWAAADVGVHTGSYEARARSRGSVYILLTPLQ